MMDAVYEFLKWAGLAFGAVLLAWVLARVVFTAWHHTSQQFQKGKKHDPRS